jgi:hypothetical protein
MNWVDDDQSGDAARRDVIELGGPPGDGRPRRAWRRWLPLGLAAGALVAAAVVAIQRGDAGSPEAAPSPSSTGVSPLRGAGASGTALPAPTVSQVGHPLLGVTARWELFGYSPPGLVRIDLAHGRVTYTEMPPLQTTGPVSLVVGSDWAVVRPLDLVLGYVVPDGRPAQVLAGELNRGGPALPGPDRRTVWVLGADGTSMTLVDALGRPAGPSITIPASASGDVQPDGGGYLVFHGIGGVYSARPDGVHRITTGDLLAAGPTRWLARECDDQYRCVAVVVDRRTGARRTLDGPDALVSEATTLGRAGPEGGVISPSGQTAALVSREPQGAFDLDLISLASGAARGVQVPVDSPSAADVVAWSPDSQWLFVAGADHRLYAVVAGTGEVRDLGVPLPPITSVVVRPAPPT